MKQIGFTRSDRDDRRPDPKKGRQNGGRTRQIVKLSSRIDLINQIVIINTTTLPAMHLYIRVLHTHTHTLFSSTSGGTAGVAGGKFRNVKLGFKRCDTNLRLFLRTLCCVRPNLALRITRDFMQCLTKRVGTSRNSCRNVCRLFPQYLSSGFISGLYK